MNSRTFTPALALLAGSVIMLAAAPAWSQQIDRDGRWEFYLGPHILLSDTLHTRGGSTLQTDAGLGLVFGFGYHVNPRLMLSGELSGNTVNYDGSTPSRDDPPGAPTRYSGQLDFGTVAGTATWHFLPGPLTPYASASLGWTWMDTNIPTGPPQLGCWWDPWYGYICRPVYNTRTEQGASYGVGAGLRWDFEFGGGYSGFARAGLDRRWLDLNNVSGSPTLDAVRIEFGARF
jgi:hypothetical protein